MTRQSIDCQNGRWWTQQTATQDLVLNEHTQKRVVKICPTGRLNELGSSANHAFFYTLRKLYQHACQVKKRHPWRKRKNSFGCKMSRIRGKWPLPGQRAITQPFILCYGDFFMMAAETFPQSRRHNRRRRGRHRYTEVEARGSPSSQLSCWSVLKQSLPSFLNFVHLWPPSTPPPQKLV